ncbi:MAG: hypothetical protein HY021_14820 [Burkholderiales bacterium]|nr:hypothetical protein [Burkholderiales bacterium]
MIEQPIPDVSPPWWRVPMVWLVISGPALVVVASLATMVLAVHGADRPLRETSSPRADAQTPATQARNHAAAPQQR